MFPFLVPFWQSGESRKKIMLWSEIDWTFCILLSIFRFDVIYEREIIFITKMEKILLNVYLFTDSFECFSISMFVSEQIIDLLDLLLHISNNVRRLS